MTAGMSLPQLGPHASADNLITVARRAEELGYDSVWVLERLLWPLNPQEPYPAATIDDMLALMEQLIEGFEVRRVEVGKRNWSQPVTPLFT